MTTIPLYPRIIDEADILVEQAFGPLTEPKFPDWYPRLDCRRVTYRNGQFDMGGLNRAELRRAQRHFGFDWLPSDDNQLSVLRMFFFDLFAMIDMDTTAGENPCFASIIPTTLLRLDDDLLRRFFREGPPALTDWFGRLQFYIREIDLAAIFEEESEIARAQFEAETARSVLRLVKGAPED